MKQKMNPNLNELQQQCAALAGSPISAEEARLATQRVVQLAEVLFSFLNGEDSPTNNQLLDPRRVANED